MKNYNLKSNKVAYTQQKLWLKTICFFLLISLFTLDVKAQYFARNDGDLQNDEILTDGIVTSDGRYLSTGFDPSTGELIINLVEYDGTFLLMKRYPIFDLTIGTSQYLINSAKCEEDPNNPQNYLIVCSTNPSTLMGYSPGTILFLEVDNSLNINTLRYYNLSISGQKLFLNNIALSNSGDELFLVGSADNGTKVNTFAASLDITNPLPSAYFARVYTENSTLDNVGMDIIQNSSDIMVVGYTLHTSGSYNYGFILPLDASGNTNLLTSPFGSSKRWGANNSTGQAFFAVTKASGSPVGFVISGTTSEGGTSDDMWTVKIDASYGQVWSSYRNYSTTYPIDRALGITERFNANTSSYEYFQTGTVVAGTSIFFPASTGTDMVVYKLDGSGNGMTLGQFTYSSVNGGRGTAIGIDDGTGNMNSVAGLVIFGLYNDASTSPSTGQSYNDFFMVKSYFNGVTCSTYLYYNKTNLLSDQTSLVSTTTSVVTYATPFTETQDQSCSPTNISDNNGGCNNGGSGGSNALVAPPKSIGASLNFSPNPFNSSMTNAATIDIKSGNEREVEVGIFDILGREYFNNKIKVKQGNLNITLDMHSINFVSGIYMLRVIDNGEYQTTMIQVK